MTASASGIVTLLACIFCGPCFYAFQHSYQLTKGSECVAPAEDQPYKPSDQARLQMKSTDYIFALLGYAIGIGNVWRFPYTIAQNGGGAALIAYIICAVLVAVPLFMYEMIVGQYTRLSTIHCYHTIRPRWASLGVASGCLLFIVLSYYGMVVAYTFPYLWNSLKTPLPWLEQGAEEFWFDHVLNQYEDIHNKPWGLGPIQSHLAWSLLAFWILVFLTVGFGKHLLAKVTYVTVIMPVFLMVILVLRSVVLEGAGQGLAFYLGKFEYHKLKELKTWAAACSQIVFSLSPGFGTALTYSSFAKPKEDVYRACYIVAISNSVFSIFGGLATFSLVGHLAFQEGLSVEEVATRSGTGLAFITMAEAMQYFGPFANVMSVLFFFMLFLVGLDSIYAWVITMVAYVDDFREERGLPTKPMWQTCAICITVLYFLGLFFTTRMGGELLNMVDHFVGSICLLLVVSMEAIMFNLDFGWQRLEFALKKATYGNPGFLEGRSLRPSWLCRFDFYATTPAIPGLLGIYLIYHDTQETYGAYPKTLVFWGWFMLVGLIAVACSTLWRRGESSLPPYSLLLIMEEHTRVSSHDFESGHFESPSINVTLLNSTHLSEAV
jgi:SNF family Na+-dependent transporter